ncbi:MAG: hypothetical protein GXY67_08260 [Clostridiales bacterium]|nr:hypothetical protein [Clostridiales bacterium]
MKKVLSMVLVVALLSLSAVALAETHGLGISTSIASSKPATAEADGTAQADTTVCTVALDDEGKIIFIRFDVAQTKIAINAKGEITADVAAEIKTKREKDDEYGMRKASPIGKEVDEQMDHLEAWCLGKTVEEAVAGANSGTDADLLAGCTIHVDAFMEALTKAAANAK